MFYAKNTICRQFPGEVIYIFNISGKNSSIAFPENNQTQGVYGGTDIQLLLGKHEETRASYCYALIFEKLMTNTIGKKKEIVLLNCYSCNLVRLDFLRMTHPLLSNATLPRSSTNTVK